MKNKKEEYVWGILRLGMGWIFFWAFLDKVFGLGFKTCLDAKAGVVNIMCKSAWINGASPTAGFLKFGTAGPLAGFYQNLAGSSLIDWLFMAGLFFIGLAFLAGIGVRMASCFGLLMMLLFYSANMPPENNPFLDDHLMYAVVMIGFILSDAGDYLGFGISWSRTKLVKKFPLLK